MRIAAFCFLLLISLVLAGSDSHERMKKPKKTTTTITTTTTTKKPASTQKCGTQGTSDRIVGGNETAIDELPFLALLYYKNPATQKINYKCGGTLILKRTILTAAHCVEGDMGKQLDFVRMGEWNTKTENDCVDIGYGEMDCSDAPIDFKVQNILIHPQRNKETKTNDLAMLILEKDVPYTDFIRPICLPSKNFEAPTTKTQALVVAGWGSTTQFIFVVSDVKMKLKVNHVAPNDCQNIYKKYSFNIDKDTHLCAGGERDKGACAGDSGGPLMFYDNGKFQISGVVSFGTKPCAEAGVPGVYANVWSYISWINQFAV